MSDILSYSNKLRFQAPIVQLLWVASALIVTYFWDSFYSVRFSSKNAFLSLHASHLSLPGLSLYELYMYVSQISFHV